MRPLPGVIPGVTPFLLLPRNRMRGALAPRLIRPFTQLGIGSTPRLEQYFAFPLKSEYVHYELIRIQQSRMTLHRLAQR
jgi:hypothetical protein